MKVFFRGVLKLLPTFLTAFLLAVAIWIFAVTSSDPTETKSFPHPVVIEIIGQDPGMIITNKYVSQVNAIISAPRSVWTTLNTSSVPVRAILDLTALGKGVHELPIKIQISAQPARLVSVDPATIKIDMEPISNKTFPVTIIKRGEVEVGFQAEEAIIDSTSAVVTGPESSVKLVHDIQVVIDYTGATQSIDVERPLQAVDKNGLILKNVTISPAQTKMKVAIVQRGGYRNVVVKVILTGQVANGHRLTNLSVYPPAVTVYSSDPELVNNLPGYVETLPLDLTGAKDDLEVPIALNLPSGMSIVGAQTVRVQVGIATIEGSVTLTGVPLEIVGLSASLQAKISPKTVDVILSGPLPILEKIRAADIKVQIDLTDLKSGTYKLTPVVQLVLPDLIVESILPSSVEVIISPKGTVIP